MPFTVAHAAAALPLRKLKLVWSAFIVGSMAPDFPYVVGSTRYRSVGHDFPGVLLFTLPVSFAGLWFYHFAIKRPIVGLLPISVQERLSGEMGEFSFGGVNRILAITVSIVVGIATHLLWDSFTHAYTWPWMHIALLRRWFELPGAGWTPMFMVLQYASTFIGLLVLGIWFLVWYHETAPTEAGYGPPLQSYVPLAVMIFVIAIVTGLLRAWLLIGMLPRTIYHFDWFMLNFATTAIAVAFWELLFYCLVTTSSQYSSRRLRSA